MPKRVLEAKLDAIFNAVARLPDDVSIDVVRSALGNGIGRRTLQRRLATLLARGRLVRTG